MKQETELFRIQYEIDENVKMDLSVFAKSLNALADSYLDFANSRTEIYPIPSKLKIADVRHKCIEIDLFPQLMAVAAVGADAISNTLDFIEHLKNIWNFFRGKQSSFVPTLKQSQSFKDIVAPVAQGQSIQFNGCTFNGNVVITADTQTANEMISRADDHISQLNLSSEKYRERVLLNIFQARDSSSNKGDRAIVSEIYPKPVKTTFESPFVKNQILHPKDGNIFDKKYLVDIGIVYKNGKPKEYRVSKIHESIKTIPENPEQTGELNLG